MTKKHVKATEAPNARCFSSTVSIRPTPAEQREKWKRHHERHPHQRSSRNKLVRTERRELAPNAETFSRQIFHETNGAKLTSALTLFQRLCNELTIRARVRQATVRIPVPRRNVVDSSQCGPRVNNDCTSCFCCGCAAVLALNKSSVL